MIFASAAARCFFWIGACAVLVPASVNAAPVSSKAGRWTVRAPGKITIELLKVATKAESPSWRPDGTVLRTRVNEFYFDGEEGHDAASIEHPAHGKYGFLLRITVPHGGNPTPVVSLSSVPGSVARWDATDLTSKITSKNPHFDVSDVWYGETSNQPFPRLFDYRFAVRTGAWSPRAIMAPLHSGAASVTRQGLTLNFRDPASEGIYAPGEMWTLSGPLGDAEYRLIALRGDGRSMPIDSVESSRTFHHPATKNWFRAPKISLSDIQEIRVEMRPLFHAEFRGVHLRPNAARPHSHARY